MTIYQKLLGDDFKKLHPQLQRRYALSADAPFNASGIMTTIQTGSKWLYPFLKLASRWKFLFPECGKDIPFEIRNTCRSLPSGSEEVHWERIFRFDNVTRYFNALMTIDPERKVVKDYLGEPHLFYSDLYFQVTSEGNLTIHSRSGSQRLVIGKYEVPIPKALEGIVQVEERFEDERGVFTIKVHIHNRILGRLMVYEGEFTEST